MEDNEIKVAKEIISSFDPFGVLGIQDYLLPKTKKVIIRGKSYEYPFDLFDDLKNFGTVPLIETYLNDRRIPFLYRINFSYESGNIEGKVFSFEGKFPSPFCISLETLYVADPHYYLSIRIDDIEVNFNDGRECLIHFEDDTFEILQFEDDPIKECSIDLLHICFQFLHTTEMYMSDQYTRREFRFVFRAVTGLSMEGPSGILNREQAIEVVKESTLFRLLFSE